MIKDLAELQKLFKLCRKQGVTDITFEGVSIKFGEMPKKASDEADDAPDEIEPELTPEQLMFFSVGGAQ